MVAGFMAAAIIAAAMATWLARDLKLALVGWLLVTNCVVSNVIVANYKSIYDLEQYILVPAVCYVTVYLLNMDAKKLWLYALHYMFLLEMLVGLLRATESISHFGYFAAIGVLYVLECATIIVASTYHYKQGKLQARG